jgi:hypothetical protein
VRKIDRFASAVVALLFMAVARAPAQQAPPRALVEDFRIDGGENEFTWISAIVPLRNGNVLVAHRGDFAATIFSPAGAVVKKVARKGAGPGEVQELSVVGVHGDSIWMSDRGQNRITFFGQDGSAGRSFMITGSTDWTRLRPDAKGAFGSRVFPRVLMPGDVALGAPGTIASALTDGVVKSIPLVRMTWDGTVSRIVAEMPVRIGAMEVRSGDRRIYSAQPFRSSPYLETSKDGRHIALVDVREDQNPAIRVIRFNAQGDTTARTEISYAPAPIPKRAVDSAVAELVKQFKQMNITADEVRAGMKIPKAYYPVQKALLAMDGTLWLRGAAANGQYRWMLVSPAGRVVETLVVPATTEIEWVDGSIWGVTRDSDDVPSVVRLKRTSG